MSPIKLSPLERLQVQGLLGALGAGLSGADASSIFGSVTDEIVARQADERARRDARLSALLDQQTAQQEAASKGILGIQELIAGAAPKTSTETTRGPEGVTTRTSTEGGIPFDQLTSQIGLQAAAIPGLTKQQLKGFLGAADVMYTPPSLSGEQRKHLNIGRGLQQNADLDQFWRDVRDSTLTGMAQKRDPKEIAKRILVGAAGQGFGTQEEQKMIAQEIASMMAARGYTGKDEVAPTAAEEAGGPGIVGSLLGPLLGAGAIAGTARAVQGLRRSGNPVGGIGGRQLARSVEEAPLNPGMGQSYEPDMGAPRPAWMGRGPYDYAPSPESPAGVLGQLALEPGATSAGELPPGPIQGEGFSIESPRMPVTTALDELHRIQLGEGQPLENLTGEASFGSAPSSTARAAGFFSGEEGFVRPGAIGAGLGSLAASIPLAGFALAPEIARITAASQSEAQGRWDRLSRDQQIEAYNRYTGGDPEYAWVQHLFQGTTGL